MKKLLNFFTSVRVAITLLIILILASILGTLIPQGRGAEEYLVRYGWLAGLFDRLQLTSLYRSIWYIALLALFSLNIVICTLARLGPKFRKAFRFRFETDPKNILALKIKDKLKLGLPLSAAGEAARRELSRHNFRLREEKDERRIYLTGHKRILGLFGSDIVHLGILVILVGGILSGLAGFRKDLSFVEGQTQPVPGADFSLRLDKFITEYYPNGSVKDWKSELSVIEGGRPLYEKTIEVNHPLNHRGFLFYQSGYGWDWQNPSLEVWVKKKADPSDIKKLWLKVGEKVNLDQGGLVISVVRFLPDFVLDERNQPATRSLELNNPAAYIEGRSGDEVVFSGWVFAKFPDFTRLHSAEETDLSFELKDVKAPQYSVIQMSRDPGVSLIWVGCALLMAGLFLAFYWPAREIRLILEDSAGKTEVSAGGISAKSRDAFETEFKGILSNLRKQK
jgi:cytochrome c biogenesis protein